jgi:hypothetical protein
MLGRKYEPEVSTRDRRAETGADVRIEESATIGEVRLALRSYGKRHFVGAVDPEESLNMPREGGVIGSFEINTHEGEE